jgi:hypothetical protein
MNPSSLGRQKLVRESGHLEWRVTSSHLLALVIGSGGGGISGEQSTNNKNPCPECYGQVLRWEFQVRTAVRATSAHQQVSRTLCCISSARFHTS